MYFEFSCWHKVESHGGEELRERERTLKRIFKKSVMKILLRKVRKEESYAFLNNPEKWEERFIRDCLYFIVCVFMCM